jgi:transcriptional regulator with XRE-family HTH domain
MPNKVKKYLAKQISARRSNMKLSQKKLADQAGLSMALISELEREARAIPRLKLSKVWQRFSTSQ